MIRMHRPSSHEMYKSGGRAVRPALAFIACTLVTTGFARQLTVDRLFDAPALAGPAITGLSISPDDARITYLRGRPDDKNRLDLWEFDIGTGASRLLVDADLVAPAAKSIPDQELSRRERQRTAALSGILDYAFAGSGESLVFPLDGKLYYADLRNSAGLQPEALATGESFVSDASVSPRSDYVAYIRDQNLFVSNLRERIEKPLTRDGGGAISNGMAEFIAEEEMDRHTGYWWSPDDRHIAFARIDESPVKVKQRVAIAADAITTIEERYPAAGEANVGITLGVVDIDSGAVTWMDLGRDTDIYLARVQWLPDGKTLAIERESRNQRRLDLLFADTATGKSRIVLTETSKSWVELNHELTFLRQSNEFIWGSSRDGFLHLYLYTIRGRLVRQLTRGSWSVVEFRGRAIKGVDEKRRLVYFVANERSPRNRDLYVTSLDTPQPAVVHRISREEGLHSITMSRDFRIYTDKFTSSTQPPQVSVRHIDGSLAAYVEQNALDARHPDAPFAADNSIPVFGTLIAADGQTLFYQLFKPHDFDPARRYPAIVSVYGGPGKQEVLDQWSGDSFAQILTRAGYVVFQLDNRGSAFRGTSFQAPLSGHLGDAEVADQIQGGRWLAAQAFVDPRRIGVWGWSYGGFMTLMLMFKAPDLFSVGVAGAPVTDWTLYDTHYTERYLGKPQDNPAAYKGSSALTYAENLRGKLLVMHGMSDDNVLFVHSTKLLTKLQDLGKPFDVMIYPGAMHGLIRGPGGRHAYATALRYFEANLGPQSE
jgi:dipeptidyl-peptidase-4